MEIGEAHCQYSPVGWSVVAVCPPNRVVKNTRNTSFTCRASQYASPQPERGWIRLGNIGCDGPHKPVSKHRDTPSLHMLVQAARVIDICYFIPSPRLYRDWWKHEVIPNRRRRRHYHPPGFHQPRVTIEATTSIHLQLEYWN